MGGVTYAHRTHGVWITTGFTCPRPRRVAHWYQSKCNIIPESSTASQLHHNISRAKLEALFKDVTIPYAKSRNPWMADKEDWKLHLFDDDVDQVSVSNCLVLVFGFCSLSRTFCANTLQDPGARCGSVARANKDIPTTTPSNKDAIHHDESSKDQDMGAASKSGISGSKAAGSDEPTTTGKGKAGPPSQSKWARSHNGNPFNNLQTTPRPSRAPRAQPVPVLPLQLPRPSISPGRPRSSFPTSTSSRTSLWTRRLMSVCDRTVATVARRTYGVAHH